MVIDPATGTIITQAGTQALNTAIKTIANRSKNINDEFKDGFKVLDNEITIRCPELIQKCSMHIQAKSGLIRNRKKRFRYGRVKKATIKPLLSLEDLEGAINILDDGFELVLKNLSQDDIFILEVEYELDSPRFLDALVKRNRAKELPSSTEDESEYWMEAKLKHINALKLEKVNIDLADVDFTVDVAVHQDIKTKIPTEFKKQLDDLKKIIKSNNPREAWRLSSQYIYDKRGGGYKSGKEMEILMDLQELFMSHEFLQFVSAKKDFYVSDCQRGHEFYDTLPFPTWPKTMLVVNRTDLSVEKPAAEGVLIYKRKKFRDALSEIL